MDVFVIIAAVILIILFVEKITKMLLPYNVLPEAYPINYPMEPMLENFADIQDCIEECNNLKTLNTIFIRIIIFQGCYADSGVLYTDLMHQFGDKEIEINSITM